MSDDKYACKKMCFVGSLCRVGDVVDETIATKAPDCFVKLKSKTYSTIQNEIERVIPEVAEMRQHEIKPLSNRDILLNKSRKIAGEEDTANEQD